MICIVVLSECKKLENRPWKQWEVGWDFKFWAVLELGSLLSRHLIFRVFKLRMTPAKDSRLSENLVSTSLSIGLFWFPRALNPASQACSLSFAIQIKLWGTGCISVLATDSPMWQRERAIQEDCLLFVLPVFSMVAIFPQKQCWTLPFESFVSAFCHCKQCWTVQRICCRSKSEWNVKKSSERWHQCCGWLAS